MAGLRPEGTPCLLFSHQEGGCRSRSWVSRTSSSELSSPLDCLRALQVSGWLVSLPRAWGFVVSALTSGAEAGAAEGRVATGLQGRCSGQPALSVTGPGPWAPKKLNCEGGLNVPRWGEPAFLTHMDMEPQIRLGLQVGVQGSAGAVPVTCVPRVLWSPGSKPSQLAERLSQRGWWKDCGQGRRKRLRAVVVVAGRWCPPCRSARPGGKHRHTAP